MPPSPEPSASGVPLPALRFGRFELRPAPAPSTAHGPPGGAAVPAAATAAAQALAAAADATPARTRLPAALPLLIGRSDDLAALGTLIDQHRLITIVGAPCSRRPGVLAPCSMGPIAISRNAHDSGNAPCCMRCRLSMWLLSAKP
jgi:hypothetical protein